ncbi:serine/threonine protein kinase [Paenibacillus sp. TRM 82003]|uniref:protein kinase domain-containing protein n=1 Tax=Kineococcus sp. TRM81007 TaxID=2925831 RepID=UPI001F5A66E9|nr:serine/threonine-protein kinase [Kineococcus sp. TRM81007]MCI2238073.1 serine/threonine protein kinase [Kineococcus sp. TRM81007]MCI3920457.1 serine/threonine protein kinase [Paenibacillus sp. TRM 82003]
MVTPFPRTPDEAPARPREALEDHRWDRPAPHLDGRFPGAAPGADPRTPATGWRPAAHAPAPGDRLGGYRLDRVVGEGGMGVVWLALDDEHRAVALKVLKPHIAADPDARARLAREVQSLERVRSPRVAEVISADVDSPWPHLVTRYVPGPSLEAVVSSRGPLRGGRLRDLGHGLAEALEAIHAAGVVHRDLKPSNVLLLDGAPVVIDFGIAHVADDVRLTSTGLVMGTPGYLSPEVVAGGRVSTATDWWGWAATVAYAASGRPPFGTGPMEVVLDRVRRADVDLAGVPADLRGPLLAALAVNPVHRPHPEQLLRALDGATTGPQPGATAAGAATTAVPAAGPGRTERPSRFSSLIGPDAPAGETTVLPPVPPVPAPEPADSTRVLPPVAPPTTPVPRAPGRPAGRQAPPGWIPRVPGPGSVPPPAGRPAPPAPFAPRPGAGRPAQQDPRAPRLGTNGQPARPQRTWTLFAGLLALVGVFAVAPTAGVVLAFAGGVVARTVDRASSALFRRRWEAGPRSTDALAVTAATPWHVLRAAVSTAFASIVPLLVGVSVVFIGGTVAGWPLGADPGAPRLLALGGLAGTLVAWFGPGSRSLQRGARTAVRSVLRGERETGVAIGVLLLVALAATVMVLQGDTPDWRPLAQSPFDRLQ